MNHTPPHAALQNLRKSYELSELIESQVYAHPMVQLQTWLDEAIASQLLEPNAMTLSTVAQNAAGQWRPSSRIVLIKGLDASSAQGSLNWFTNYDSRKGQELAANPFASVQFHWLAHERQVRIEGVVERLSSADSDAYFHSRPLGSRIGAWASAQSAVIKNREQLEATAQSLSLSMGQHPQRPAHWGGYRLRPDAVEFWQGRPNRLHDRLQYRWEQDCWVIRRLAP